MKIDIRQGIKALTFSLGLVLATGTTAFAQSIITLDSLDLEEDKTPETQKDSALSESCLVNPDQEHCGEAQSSSQSFSLNDVVNLGIIDRSEVEVEDENGEIVRVEERVEPLPSIDLEILFDYDSAELRPDQVAPLIAVSQDLQDVDFDRAQLVLMGHTDGVGSAVYNKDLSLRRARSVAAFLADAARIPTYRIRTSGMGFDYLRYPGNPEHPGNRRVQILLVE